MLENDKECDNCTFDTTAIVTVDIDNWDYCPVCGSEFQSEDYEDNQEGDMKEIPISTPNDKGDSDDDEKNSSEDSDDEDEVDEFVEQELERLKDMREEED